MLSTGKMLKDICYKFLMVTTGIYLVKGSGYFTHDLILKISRVLFLRSSWEFILQNSCSLNPRTTEDNMREEAQCVFLGNAARCACIFNHENQMPVFHESLLHPFSGFVCWAYQDNKTHWSSIKTDITDVSR